MKANQQVVIDGVRMFDLAVDLGTVRVHFFRQWPWSEHDMTTIATQLSFLADEAREMPKGGRI